MVKIVNLFLFTMVMVTHIVLFFTCRLLHEPLSKNLTKLKGKKVTARVSL